MYRACAESRQRACLAASLGRKLLFFAQVPLKLKELEVSLTIPVTIEISDEGLAVLSSHLGNGPDETEPTASARPAPVVATPDDIELPESWRLVEEQSGVTYTWPQPDGPDVYDPFRTFEGTTSAGSVRLAIGECVRTNVRGKDRKYFITHHIGPAGGKRAIAEFLETDDYEETGDLIAIIKGKGGGAKLYDPTDDLPAVYLPYRTETYRDRIDYPRSYQKLGIVASEDDVETILNHTLIQVLSRGLDRE